ncbi:MAG TPA: alpha-2-macroglobulin family protein, partial [Thermoanaerobaculia bacterium]|nr:alpha-2-macroglobulin family protein [Thermoanaerobaculia bacterium]
MRRIATLALLLLLPLLSAAGPYDALKKQAESSYDEKSFGRAHELYEEAAKLETAPEEKRWIKFRLADTGWRADAANPTSDPTARESAEDGLEAIIRDSGDDHDRVWAEAQESLGDMVNSNRTYRNPSQAQQHYIAALDWWAGSDDLAVARRRYLDLVWKTARTQWDDSENAYNVPKEVLVNAVAIADNVEERAHARFLLATKLISEQRPDSVERAFEHLELIIRDRKATPWYDDALFLYAQQLASQGAVVVLENGEAARKHEYLKALELFKRIREEFKPSETRYYDQAKAAIEEIVLPAVTVSVGSNFLPRSEQEFVLSWRNVPKIELAITQIDLVRDAKPRVGKLWVNDLCDIRTPLRRWSFDTKDTGEHEPGMERVRVTPRLDSGAYVVSARANGKTSCQLLLINDTTIVTQTLNGALQIYVADVMTGEPVPNAQVRVWTPVKDVSYEMQTTQTDANGFARARIASNNYGGQTVVFASKDARQAHHETYTYGARDESERQWRIYAFTDRPAYRPEETVQWKIIARTRSNDEWSTPHDALDYEIIGPRNEKVSSGKATLNAFGTFWSEVKLTSSMPLGAYQINFRSTTNNYVGSAQLFRLEEYKLPEFRVSVSTPEENGEKKRYRLGDTVEASVDAEYYFGGPVANATVNVVIYQRPFYRYWFPWREYPWYFDSPNNGYNWRGNVLRQETLKTDESGHAIVRIESPRDGSDTSYVIEARVTDASRREVVGEGTVNVTRQRYAVLANPEHYIHRPGERASINFKAMDANDQPVEVTGNVRVVRRRWDEKDAQYHDEEISATKVTTDAKGEAKFTFTPDREGYFIVKWSSEDVDRGRASRAADLVQVETGIWAGRNATTDLGYHTSSGLEIVLDKETARSGETAPVMIVTPASGRWVVLTTTSDEILDTQLLHLDGTVKLVQLPLDDRHVPNFFITAASIFDRTLALDTKSIVVPPVEHFIDVDVKLDREEFEPRAEGAVTITTRDDRGRPVAAEVALSVSDESVTAIAQDPAGDPRQFFFGERRYSRMQVSAGVQAQRFVRLVVDKNGQLIDERVMDERRRDRAGEKDGERGQHQNFVEDAIQETGVMGGAIAAEYGAYTKGITTTAEAPMVAPPPSPAPQSFIISGAAINENLAKASYERNEAVQVEVRSDFRSTALWKPDVITDANGTATVKLKFPEALTTWRANARAVTAVTQVGMGTTTARTKMPLIVRLQAPRFFVAGDRVVISAVINNNTDEEVRVTPSLDVEGVTVTGDKPDAITIAAHGEGRADWTVLAEHAGNAKLRVTGRSATRGDAMEKTFVVYDHGVDKLLARSGKLRSDEAIIKLDLPARRDTQLTVQIAPSLAVTMVDTLPYLINYPYGCTEQTMSRFLPAAIVARTLSKNGLDIGQRIDRKKLDDVTAQSMARLYDFQHGDGGWGWWKQGDSDPFMTAYVVWGFSIARDAGLRVKTDEINRAVAWLEDQLPKHESRWHDATWLLHAISAWRGTPTAADTRAFNDVWSH